MRKIFQYIAMAVAVVAMASCSQEELFEPVAPQGIRFSVSEFPAYGDMQTRAIGIQDAGKTAWVDNDKLLLSITFKSGKKQGYTLEYQSGKWSLNDKVLADSDITEVLAVYAPDCEIKSDGSIGLVSDKLYGMAEYIPATTSFDGFNVSISFTDVTRTYSRLRIVAMSGQRLSVATDGFTPAGTYSVPTEPYTLTADENGNAFLYGTFAERAKVTVTTPIVRNEQPSDKTIADYTFTAENYPNGTVNNTSYVLDAQNGYEEELSDGVTTYKVYDADGLLAWNAAAQDNLSPNLVLMKDIDMSDAGEWTPVGNGDNPYTGTIDGNDYTISNIELAYNIDNSNNKVYVGFVGRMGDGNLGGEMKDITFDSPKISMPQSYSSDYASVYVGIVGYMDYESTMTNVSVTGEATWNVNDAPERVPIYAGVLVGYLQSSVSITSTVKNCHVENGIKLSVTADDADLYVGGIAGYSGYSYLLGCTSAATISVTGSANYEGFVGGIVGYADFDSNTNGCVYYGDLEAALTGEYANLGIGGIAGGVYAYSSDFNVVGCYITGEVTGDTGNAAPVGAIVGYTGNNNDIVNSVKSCYWSGNDGLNAWGYYDGNGDCTKVVGTDWSAAMIAMNKAIRTWNESNDNLCGYHYEINMGDDAATRPLILREGLPV